MFNKFCQFVAACGARKKKRCNYGNQKYSVCNCVFKSTLPLLAELDSFNILKYFEIDIPCYNLNPTLQATSEGSDRSAKKLVVPSRVALKGLRRAHTKLDSGAERQRRRKKVAPVLRLGKAPPVVGQRRALARRGRKPLHSARPKRKATRSPGGRFLFVNLTCGLPHPAAQSASTALSCAAS